ncbi:MAG: hypothetical protein ACTHU0_27090, partial [Kofleriaceae bacterium]
MGATYSIRLDFGRVLHDDMRGAQAIADILAHPCFSNLDRVSARHNDRWTKYAKRTSQLLAQHLTDSSCDAVSLDTRRGRGLVASAEIESSLRTRAPSTTSLLGYVVLPVEGTDPTSTTKSICELAAALRAAAGFIAAEPDYGRAHRLAVGASRPKGRDGLAALRQRGRRARDWKSEQLATKIAAVEWGTFLGPGHLEQLDLEALRNSGAFDDVVVVSPQLVYLQVTMNPLD